MRLVGRVVVTERDYARLTTHFLASPSERFAFLLCRHVGTGPQPVFVARDLVIVDDRDTRAGDEGTSVADAIVDTIINRAVRDGLAILEIHSHNFGPPEFSTTDRDEVLRFARFVLNSLTNRPYGAAVWAEDRLYGEWFAIEKGQMVSGPITSACVIGGALRQVISEPAIAHAAPGRAERQIPLLGLDGQRSLETLKFAVVGLGGIGSHVVQALAYLGAKHYVLIDADDVEETNLNRLVFATPLDVGLSKVGVARRFIEAIVPDSTVEIVGEMIAPCGSAEAAARQGDVILGCVDDDGPRFLLNRAAVAASIPYLDAATGIILRERGPIVGGRIATTVPGGPCLVCTDELDVSEVRAYFQSDRERRDQVTRGYIDGSLEPSPTVVSLNGVIANVAVTELALFLAGVRPPTPRIDLEVVGDQQFPGPRLMPRRGVARNPGCPECASVYEIEQSPDEHLQSTN
jgi:molybdopterin/thiamine biosynthesis adenylyltransferase